jgi:hypothetical protein
MPLPTGPAVVGLEPVVLPALATLHEPETFGDLPPQCDITAPTCRFGPAVYRVAFLIGASAMRVAFECELPAGAQECLPLPSRLRPQLVELHLVDVTLAPGALRDLTPDELADALQHPFPRVRERAMLDAGASETG